MLIYFGSELPPLTQLRETFLAFFHQSRDCNNRKKKFQFTRGPVYVKMFMILGFYQPSP